MSAEARHRRPRTIGVVVLVLIALVALAVIASLSLDQGDTDPIKIDGAGDVRKLVGGIRQLGARLGDDDAPVTIQVFNDMQCTDCADFQLDVIEPLIAEKVRAGEVKLEFVHYSVSDRAAGAAAIGAVAAGLQGQQWQFIELFVRNQEEARRRGVTPALLDEVAKGVLNLNVEQWQRDLDDPEVADIVEADDLLAIGLRIPAEPGVLVEGPEGSEKLIETPTSSEIEAAIAKVGS